MRYASYLRKLFVVLLVILIAIYIRGWTGVRYDSGDTEIGKKVTFSKQMVMLTNLPDNYASKLIVKKYGSVLQEKRQWLVSIAWFPAVKAEDIPCDEVFVVREVFHEFPRGVLEKMFSAGEMKLYVIDSENHKNIVVMDDDYASYSKDVGVTAGTYKCSDTVE